MIKVSYFFLNLFAINLSLFHARLTMFVYLVYTNVFFAYHAVNHSVLTFILALRFWGWTHIGRGSILRRHWNCLRVILVVLLRLYCIKLLRLLRPIVIVVVAMINKIHRRTLLGNVVWKHVRWQFFCIFLIVVSLCYREVLWLFEKVLRITIQFRLISVSSTNLT